jgi:F-box and WD-40 domain protein CDC4
LRVDGGKISAGDVRRGRSSRLITAGNDGRVRIFDAGTGALVREVGAPSDSVWKVVTKGNALAVCCRRGGKTVTEIWGFAPEEEEMKGLHRLFA